MTKGQVAEAFAPLQDRLRRLVRDYNPGEQNLHFLAIEADENLILELVALARDGHLAVKDHEVFFLDSSLHEPNLWYDLFLLIRQTVLSRGAREISEVSAIEELVQLLVEIAKYTQQSPGDDIWKRNQEALSNTILAYEHLELERTARAVATESHVSTVQSFVEDTLRQVQRARYDRVAQPSEVPATSTNPKELRTLFNEKQASELAEKAAVTTSPWSEGPKLSTRFAYFADQVHLVIVGGAQEKGKSELALVYGLQHRHGRELVLILPHEHVGPTLLRLAWLKQDLPIRMFSHRHGRVLAIPTPSRDKVRELIKSKDSFVTRVHHLGHKATWTAALTSWAGAHPELDPAHRPDNRSWHCRGQRVLRVSLAGAGVSIVAGIDWKTPSSEKPGAYRVDLNGPIERSELDRCQEVIEQSITARLQPGSPAHKPDEHWLQAILRRDPRLIGVEVPAFRELQALRCIGTDDSGSPNWSRGYIDLIGVDPQGTIRIVETKLGPFDMLVLQGLDYLMWCEAHKAELCTKLGVAEKAPFAIQYVVGGKRDGTPLVSTYTKTQVAALADDIDWRFHTAQGWFKPPLKISELPAGALPPTGKQSGIERSD